MMPNPSSPGPAVSLGLSRRFWVRGLCLLSAAVLASLPARANLRAPLLVDGFFSGSLKCLPFSEAVRLLREDLSFSFPAFDAKLSAEAPRVRITVRYVIANGQAAEVEFAVRFLAVDIAGLTAALDGRALEVELAPDKSEKSECLRRLTRHRAAFTAPLYREYLSKIRYAAGLKDSPDTEWLAALEGRDLSNIEPGMLYSFMRLGSQAEDFRSAGMRLRLRPGTNVLEISYSQRMYIDERGYGYSSGWPEKGFTGADYLLYPALSWPLDPAFRLAVSVEIPELYVKRFLHHDWLPPTFRSSLKLEEPAGAPAQPRTHRFKGEFPNYPADILTVLFWFDEGMSRYLDK